MRNPETWSGYAEMENGGIENADMLNRIFYTRIFHTRIFYTRIFYTRMRVFAMIAPTSWERG